MNLPEFQEEVAKIAGYAQKDGIRCVKCRQPFTNQTVFTTAGWREAQISGLCEKCWDSIFAEEG